MTNSRIIAPQGKDAWSRFTAVLDRFSVGKPIKYAKIFFGIVKLLAIIPTYASLLLLQLP